MWYRSLTKGICSMGVGIPYVNVQYMWHSGEPWTGCLYFEIGTFGAWCAFNDSNKGLRRYEANPKHW
jgi:hypothetical protein